MKHLLLLFLATFLLQTAIAQDYQVVTSVGNTLQGDPLDIFGPNPDYILEPPATTDLSAWQALPFPFEFYGVPMNGYVASRNGFISFTEADANSGASENTALPTADGPNNAIYAFWEALSFPTDGYPDISTWTYGVAPNRVHLIRWFSLLPANTDRSLFFAIRLYECGDFDIVHAAGNPDITLSGTVGCENADGSMATMVGNSPNHGFSPGNWEYTDDVVYTFYGAEYNLELTSLNFPTRIQVGEQDVSGTLTNKGTTAINSFHLNYTVNGGPVQTMEITGVNIAPNGGTYSYVHDIPWMATTSGEIFTLCIYADQLNGSNVDQHPCNDQACKDIFTYTGTSGNRTVLIEEFSGAWCGYCPDGEAILEDILADHPDDVVALAYHDGDAMETSVGYDVGSLIDLQGYPQAAINRVFAPGLGLSISREYWPGMVAAQLDRYTPAEVRIEHSYNPDDRVLQVTLTADFVDDAYGDMRFALAITEDNVTGTGSGYDQVNNYNNTFGHPFAGMGDPIVGYQHQRVVRAMPSGALGTPGIVPNIVSSGAQYSEEFQFIVPANWDIDQLSLVGILAYHSPSAREREIINVAKEKLMAGPTSSNDLSEVVTEALLFPNPTRNRLNFSFSLTQNTPASMLIYDGTGRQISQLGTQTFSTGQHQLNYDVSQLAPGIYYLNMLGTGGVIYSGKFVVVTER